MILSARKNVALFVANLDTDVGRGHAHGVGLVGEVFAGVGGDGEGFRCAWKETARLIKDQFIDLANSP